MKIFILCGGTGTRLDEEGKPEPKPLIQIGKDPILLHIIKIYSYYGFNEFVLCLGYKGKMIIDYFKNKYKKKIIEEKKINSYIFLNIKLSNQNYWKVYLVDTKINYGTGGRIKYAFKNLGLDEDIMMTYGDGVSNININQLVKFHYLKNKLTTLTAVFAPHRYGILKIKKNIISGFDNKNANFDRINGGFFIISKKAISFIKNFNQYWESEPMQKIISKKQFSAFKHNGFWASLDTLKDKKNLNKLWYQKKAPWKIW